MMGNKTNEIIEELFKSRLQKYEEGLEKKMRVSKCFLIVLVYCIIFFIKQV